MKFAALHIENFLAVSEATVRLADRGLLLIQGANDDDPSASSNGAGKSSVADALCWCLFGTTARGVSGDAIVNRTAGKGTLVEVVIDDGANWYAVTRHRKHKTGKNSLKLETWPAGGVRVDITKGTDKLTQAEVERVIGCSYEVFKAAVYAGQEQMPDLPAMTDKALKLLVEEAAGTTLLAGAYEIARGELAVAKAALDSASADLDRVEERIADCANRILELKSEREDYETKRRDAAKGLREFARNYANDAKRIDAEIKKLNKAGVLAELEDCREKIAAVEHERVEERRLAEELRLAETKVALVERDVSLLAKQIKTQRAAIEGIDGRVGTPCGECGKAYCEHDLAEARKIATEKLRATVDDYKSTKALLDAAQNAQKSCADALEAYRASMTSITTLNALSDDLKRAVDDIVRMERERDQAIRDARSTIKRVEEVEAQDNPIDATIERETKRAAELAEQKEKALDRVKAATGAYELADAAVKVFGPAGARAHILDTVTPFLNDRTAAYLGALSDGAIDAVWTTLAKTAKGDLREKFQIEVTHAKGGESFAALSGGEKRKVRVATALALQDLVASRAIKPVDLFIGDEIDDALDPAGLERLMAVLEEKARERGSVLVISHNDLKDWISESIIVRKSGGRSVLEDAA